MVSLSHESDHRWLIDYFFGLYRIQLIYKTTGSVEKARMNLESGFEKILSADSSVSCSGYYNSYIFRYRHAFQ